METHPNTRAGRTVSELLEDSGNCRQIIKQELSLHRLSDSLFSEQQKLRHVLDWAHRFLRSDSDVHHEFCRADSLILTNADQRETHLHPVSCVARGNEVFGGGGSMQVWQLEPSNYENGDSDKQLCAYKPSFSDDPCIPFSFTPRRDQITWLEYKEMPENLKILKLQDATDKQTPSQDSACRRSKSSDRNTDQTLASDGATSLIKDSTSCWSSTRHKRSVMSGTVSNWKLSHETTGAQSEIDTSGHQMELSKVKADGKVGAQKEVMRMGERKGKLDEDQETGSALSAYAKNSISNSEPEKTQEQTEETAPALTVYEHYQLCVDRLHHLRGSRHIDPGCFIESPAKEGKTSQEMAAPAEAPASPTSGFELKSPTTNPEIKKHLNKRVTAAEITKERCSDIINKNQGGSKCKRNRATLMKHCDNLTVKETPAGIHADSRPVCQRNITSNTHLDLDSSKCRGLIKGTAGGITSTDHVPAVEKTAALSPNPGLRIRCHPGVKGRHIRVKDQKKKAGGRGASMRLCEKPSVSLSSQTNKEISRRPQSSGVIKHTKRHTPEGKVKPTPACRDAHKCLQPKATHTPLHDDPTSSTSDSSPGWGHKSNLQEVYVHFEVKTSLVKSYSAVKDQCEETDCKHSPVGVAVCDRWLCLPDEVWLFILSLLPHGDLCRLVQVCSRLHTLAADHTLWKDVRVENCSLTERWLLCVSRRRPRSLRLYSCSGLSLTSCRLEMFLTLCRKTLEELKVTSCTGPGLHGDQMLPLIGQLCDHLTSVDVSWSGATDAGVRALSDCHTGLHLKSVVLNGCRVTDDPLMKLVKRHEDSLCRLEVFGCQYLTPSCLQTVFEMCPGLQHLNIGQVPKVNTHSLAVMTSQLKCLISLNLTGLQAVTDATADTLLQNCVELQSLTFSSCPGVTDLTLHSIGKYTPYIRSLDVSGCKAVTDAGVQSLALGCRRLQQLDLSSTGTGNRGVTLLANYCSRHLHTVKLSFCHITLENIMKLCRYCKRLKVLHVYGCTQLPTETEIRDVNSTVKVYPPP